jgi:hypothetical protein
MQATMYYMQSKEEMFNAMRPYVIITNLFSFVWFILIQFYRFKDTGRACSGDYLTDGFMIPFFQQSNQSSSVNSNATVL